MLRLLFILAAICAAPAAAWAQQVLPPSAVAVENLEFDARDDDLRLHLRNKHPEDYYSPTPGKTVLFVHGALFPGIATFDHAIDGQSWMDYLARRGYDVYALDIRGFGQSAKPADMAGEAGAGSSSVDNHAALRDVSKAVEYILSRRGIDRLNLIGWAWGATLAGSYAAESGAKINKLVLYAPQWLADAAGAAPPAGAWRNVALAEVRSRWGQGLPDTERRELISTENRNAWFTALSAGGDALLKIPNGPAVDALKTWGAGTQAWRPERISAPSMVVQGEWDSDYPPAQGLSVFAHLTGAATRRYVLIGEGTHLLVMEKNRRQLFQAVYGFLEEQK